MSRDHRDQRGGHRGRIRRGRCVGCPYCAPVTGRRLRRQGRREIHRQLRDMHQERL